MLNKKDIKIELEKEWAAVKKWKEDFDYMTADMMKMDEKTKAWYTEEGASILQRRRAMAAMKESSSMEEPHPTPVWDEPTFI
jgi:hypothetical protein